MISFLRKLFTPKSLEFASAGRTDPGLVRSKNEDAYAIFNEQGLFVVADGMGGHNAGEIASRAAVKIVGDQLLAAANLAAMHSNPHEARHALSSSFDRANEVVISMAARNEEWQGMGCTMVVAFINNSSLHVCHVGDARCYLLSEGHLRQLTNDHTTLVELRRNLDDTAAIIEQLQGRHVVTRVIGYPFPEPPEYSHTDIKVGDRVLLCSDGLWSMLDEVTIRRVLAAATSPSQAVDRLTELANKAGGSDNITGIAIFC